MIRRAVHCLVPLLLLAACGSQRPDASDRPRKSRAEATDKARAKPEKAAKVKGPKAAKATTARPDQANKPLPRASEEPLTGQPDILFITWDTTRADHVGTYGYARDTTPRFDAFAEESALFERYIVPMATTLPTHTSLFTSVHPEEHGIVANVTFNGQRFVPPPTLVPLASYLQDIGFKTGGFVSSSPLKKSTGIALGFDHYDQPSGSSRRAKDTTDAAIAWLDKHQGKAPVFMWVHYYDPHAPYEPIERLKGHFKTDAATRTHIQDRAIGAPKSAAQVAQRINNYDADIYYTDGHFGRLLARWDADNHGDESVVIVAGDHGEGLMQHDHLEHGLLWDEQLHSLMAIRAPNIEPGRFPHPVQAVDVVPTVMARLALDDMERYLKQSSGVDLLTDFEPRPAVSRMSRRQVHLGSTISYAATTERWKLIADKHKEVMLFDLQADPHELNDLSDEHPDIAASMLADLEAVVTAQKAKGDAMGAGKTEKVDETIFEELREIGYVE